MRLRWTGLGCLTPVLVLASFVVVGVAVDASFGRGFDARATLPALILCAGWAALSPVHWWIGRALGDQHTFMDLPMERGAVLQAALAVMLASIMVGRATSAWLGWGMLVAVPVIVMVVAGRRRWRERLRGVADRAELARARGWRYRKRDSALPLRWKSLYGRKVTLSMGPFGIISGELRGLPFTIFDTELESGSVRAVTMFCAVHLPVSYPHCTLTVDRTRRETTGPPQGDMWQQLAWLNQTRPQPGDLRAETEVPAFGQALLSPAVRDVTLRRGLLGWQIDGRDLIHWGGVRDSSHPADEVLGYVEAMVELANTFPAGLAERYGSPPTQDIPFATSARPSR